MEFQFKCRGSEIGCEVTLDQDNNKYMIRKEDTSGEVFNSSGELADWIKENWTKSFFVDDSDHDKLMEMLSNLQND